jgi:hypothetical protein
LERRSNSAALSKLEQLPAQGSIATAMRGSGGWFAAGASRTSNLAQQWRLGRRPSATIVDRKFELLSNNYGKSNA